MTTFQDRERAFENQYARDQEMQFKIVARRNRLQLDRGRLMETMRLIASTYEEPDQVIELYRNDPQLLGGLQNRVMEEQVTDWIAERAKHTEQSLSFQDAIGPQG